MSLQPGHLFQRTKRLILDVRHLSNGWVLVKTENGKSVGDFRVRTVYQREPVRYYTPKHAHFAIDLYGKWCADPQKAAVVCQAVVQVWQRQPVELVLQNYRRATEGLPGYDLEYILNALDWILEQEDVNFTGRPTALQHRLDAELHQGGVQVPPGRQGSQLAMVLLQQVARGRHPVEAMLAANLDVLPMKRGRGAV